MKGKDANRLMKRYRVKGEGEKMRCPGDDDELDRDSLLLPVESEREERRGDA